jgi:hypothetical protein
MLKTRLLPIATVVAGVAVAYACKTTPNESSDIKEAWDTLNDPKKFGASQVDYQTLSQADWTEGKLNSVPWSDTYWPLKAIGFADRWIDEATLDDFQLKTSASGRNANSASDRQKFFDEINKEISAALADAKKLAAEPDWKKTIYVSPAEKYDIGVGDANLSLTSKELNAFANNRWSYETQGISWGWMGHCHGWAPAAYMYDAPKHGVLVKNSSTGKEVMFTPGDVRGLLTKTAADNSFNEREQFMGTRCNEARTNIPRDELNRIIDGAIGSKWNEGSKNFEKYRRIRVIYNNWNYYDEINDPNQSILFRFEPDAANPNPGNQMYYLSFKRWANNDSVAEVDIREISFDWRGRIRLGKQYTAAGNLFKYFKDCRDLNAGSFHTVLARSLSKGGAAAANRDPRGFVMDITRDDEVWNHPIYSFRSKVGKPTALKIQSGNDEVVDPYETWRAKGTKEIVDVYTEVVYGVENGPYVAFKPSDDAVHKNVYHYTLELDSSGKVIGGEWHGRLSSGFDTLQAKEGEALLKDLREIITNPSLAGREDAPDFMWGYAPKAPFRANNRSVIKPDFVKKVYDCSVAATASGNHTVDGMTFDYVECAY